MPTSGIIKLQLLLGSFILSSSMLYLYYRYKRYVLLRECRKNLDSAIIKIISNKTNPSDLESALIELKHHVKKHPVLGFDCEWVSTNGKRKSVALLQLATYNDYCLLIRLHTLKNIPAALEEVLKDPKTYKVGVDALHDARYLYHDYNLEVNGCLDLRHVSSSPLGLAKLAAKHLDLKMKKNWYIRCSDWEAEELTPVQIKYAADDVLIAIELWKKLTADYKQTDFQSFLDLGYSQKSSCNRLKQTNKVKPLKKTAKISVRKAPLYDNCFMEAPDGELLCTCDYSKAQWYIDNSLAVKIKNEPLTIRLNFEPAGRAVGESGKYYTEAKLNRCVVCGRPDSYIRKNIVPREYRKSFPVDRKSHSSHDVVLLCLRCHQLSNQLDQNMRKRLSKLCQAPIGTDTDIKYFDTPNGRELRSAARALMYNSEKIPVARKEELKKIILKYYPECKNITKELLETAQTTPISTKNEDYLSHGEKVVKYFEENFPNDSEGLFQLEQQWRKFFIDSMNPQFLPNYWSVTHNKGH